MILPALAVAAAETVCLEVGASPGSVAVDDLPANESSGLAAGRADPGVFYTHDDGGDPSLFLFSLDGSFLGEQRVDGATNQNWEDVAGGPCPAGVAAEHCLWIGDIGDNEGTRASVTVYVIPESRGLSEAAVSCALRYPEGKARDAEALFVDPAGTLRIVSKEDDGEAKVFRLDAPRCDGTVETLVLEHELQLGSAVTGAAMRADGKAVVFRSLTHGWMWVGCEVDLRDPPIELDLGAQPQGEAIAFTEDGGLVVTSEGEPFRVWEIPCAESGPAPCDGCGCGSGSNGLLFVTFAGSALRRGRRSR